ncbi:MAG TPA: helix-turn-helix transcriptional regulator [Chitinophagaceae bacterium]|jgi:AraC-like DNA-binding protein
MNRNAFRFISSEQPGSFNNPVKGNFIFFSKLNEAYTENSFRNFSIKFCVAGNINYHLNGNRFKIFPDQFLIAAKQPFGPGYIDSEEQTKSICIDISPHSMAEAFTVLSAKETYEFDNYLSEYFDYPNFTERICNAHQSLLYSQLGELKQKLVNEDFENLPIDDEWFLELTEKIILQENDICKALNGIHSVRHSTRKEVFRRLHIAKKFMDETCLRNPSIDEVAKVCAMSQFHFYRCFRQAFRLSPYQYLMNKRLEHAASLIIKCDYKLADIATRCGFADLFTFSKAFKRHYGTPPSLARQVNHLAVITN